MAEGSAGLPGLLAAAEARMPVESAEVVACELARSLDARTVCFLITDFTGNAVVRLSNADAGEDREHIGLPGTVYEQVPCDQRVFVREGHPDGASRGRISPIARVMVERSMPYSSARAACGS